MATQSRRGPNDRQQRQALGREQPAKKKKEEEIPSSHTWFIAIKSQPNNILNSKRNKGNVYMFPELLGK